jgi:DNA-binding NtrC family response regulator
MAMGALTTGHEPTLGNGTARPVPPPTASPAIKSVVGFHGAVTEFKRRLIEATLTQAGGNRTRAAKALGLQRTYLLRLMREFEIRIPPQQMPPRRSEQAPTRLPSQIH